MSTQSPSRLLQDKVCLVTACDSLSRLAIADRFADGRAQLILTASDEEAKAEVEALAAAPREQFSVEILDVTSPASWDHLACSIADRFGGLDVAVQGLSRGYVKSIHETPLELYRMTNAVNMEGCFLGLKTLHPLMKTSGGGSIIHLSSIYAKTGRADAAAFCAGAGGVAVMTKAAALEFAKTGSEVRVNAVLVGGIDEGAVSDITIDYASPDHLAAPPPLGSFGHFADVAETALFLASDQSKYVTGLVLPVDGGRLAV